MSIGSFRLKKLAKTGSFDASFETEGTKYVGLEVIVKELIQLGIIEKNEIASILDFILTKVPSNPPGSVGSNSNFANSMTFYCSIFHLYIIYIYIP